MTIPAGFPYPLKQVVEIPLEQIIPNPHQPRKFEHKEAIQLLAASLRAKGQEVAARVRPLTEEERTIYPNAWVMLIGGHGRREAALANQFKTLKCTVEDIAPEETLSTAARDNNIRDMHWWEWYLVIEGVEKASPKSQREIADELGQSVTRVNWALKITKTLNPASRALVQENLQKTLKNDVYDVNTKNKGFSITEQTLLTLAGLEDPAQVQQALQVVLDDYLTADQAKKLVEHMKTGQAVDTYGQAQRPLPTPRLRETGQSAPMDSTPAGRSPQAPQPSEYQKPSTPTPAMSETEQVAWDMALGISILSRIKAKVKKGERPTLGEALLLAVDKLVHLLIHLVRWVSKNGIRGIFRAVKWVWHTFMESLKLTGLYPIFRAICFLAFFLFAIWFGWEAYHYGFFHPVKVIAAKVLPTPLARYVLEQPTPVPTEVPVVVATPVPTVQAAIISTPTTTDVPKAVAIAPKKKVVTSLVQPTPTVVKKTDVAGDVLKAAPAGVDVAKKLFGL